MVGIPAVRAFIYVIGCVSMTATCIGENYIYIFGAKQVLNSFKKS